MTTTNKLDTYQIGTGSTTRIIFGATQEVTCEEAVAHYMIHNKIAAALSDGGPRRDQK